MIVVMIIQSSENIVGVFKQTKEFLMKKLIFLIPLMFLSSVENVNAMRNGRKSMRKMRMRRGSKRRRGHQSRRDKRVVQRQKGRTKKTVDLTGCLSVPQKKFSLNSLVPKLSFSFNKRSLASSVLLLCMIFGQFLGGKQVESHRLESPGWCDRNCQGDYHRPLDCVLRCPNYPLPGGLPWMGARHEPWPFPEFQRNPNYVAR